VNVRGGAFAGGRAPPVEGGGGTGAPRAGRAGFFLLAFEAVGFGALVAGVLAFL